MEIFFNHVLKNLQQKNPKIWKTIVHEQLFNYNCLYACDDESWKVSVTFSKASSIFTFHASHHGGPSILVPGHLKSQLELVTNTVVNTATEKNLSCFVEHGESYRYRLDEFEAIGANAKLIYLMLEKLEEVYDLYFYPDGGSFMGEYANYRLKFDIDACALILLRGKVELIRLSSINEAEDFIRSERKLGLRLAKSEDMLAEYAQKLDPTSYFKRSTRSYLYILGNKIVFSLSAAISKTKTTYKASFDRKTISTKTLEELESKVKEVLQAYYKSNRLKSVTGKGSDMAGRHFNRIFGDKVSFRAIKNRLESKRSFEEIVNIVKMAREDEVVEVETDEVKNYTAIFKTQKRKAKIKSAYKVKNLLFIVTAGTYYVFEGEISAC